MAFTKITSTNISDYAVGTQQLSNTATAAFAKTLAPKILYANVASNTYSVLDDTAVNVGGGFIVVTGAEFQSGAQVLIDTTLASSVTYVNSTTLRAQVPAKSASSYNLYVVNPDGGTGLKVAGITYSGSPTWVTTSPLTDQNSNTPFNITFSATDANTYSVADGSTLPTGTTLLANGYFYGNVSVGSATSYNFSITATDTDNQDSTKAFSLTVNSLAPTYAVSYLVVAGGGGGAGPGFGCDQAGGGGAGGLLTSSVTLTRGSPYTVTVGAGGNGSTSSPRGVNGSNSVLSGAPISTVTSLGGGGGGAGCAPSSIDYGAPGGSGGGAGQGGKPGAGVGGNGTPGQGNPGGNSTPNNEAGGGGGGAGAPGFTGPATTNPGNRQNAGAGGTGYTWPITGNTYAGGGGGGAYAALGGTGGPGGGGRGSSPITSEYHQPGVQNTGGGGGGRGVNAPPTGGSGGSGIVILSMATAQYPGSAPGANVTTSGANTIVTFNSSGTYTA
jgi:hypothetical protein